MDIYTGALLLLGSIGALFAAVFFSYLKFRKRGMEKILEIFHFHERERVEDHPQPNPKIADDV